MVDWVFIVISKRFFISVILLLLTYRHMACEEERTEVAELLIKHEASTTCQNKVQILSCFYSGISLKRTWYKADNSIKRTIVLGTY